MAPAEPPELRHDSRRGSRGRRRAGIAVLSGAALLLSGCAQLFPAACSMPAIAPPHVAVDARAWHGTHPGGRIRVCYAGSCDEKDESALEFELVVPAAVAPGEKHQLAVTETGSDATATFTSRVALTLIPGQTGGPCPMPDQWSLRLTILPDGRLRFDGADDGHLVIPTVPQTPVTAPTAAGP